MPRPDFAAHRKLVLDRLAEDEAVLLIGAPTRIRSNTSEYPYRPDSDVFWLTGWEDPEVAVFLRPGEAPFTMFVQRKDREREIWDGFRPGPEGARADFGADVAYTWDELGQELPRLLQGVRALHYAFGRDADMDALVTGAITRAARAARRNGLTVPETFHHPAALLHELRLVKRPDEIAVMRRAAAISAAAHREAMAATRPGMREYEIEAVLLSAFRRHGSTGPGYIPIVAGGNNSCVLHYIRNRDLLRERELLLVDAGCEHWYYTADITRTWPVDGRFTGPQRAVYELVLRAQLASIDAARAGRPVTEVHDTSVRLLTEAMVELGLLEGDVDTLIREETYKRYYMHGTSHWLGLDVHDVGRYARDGAARTLEPGMVLTVEPGLYIAPDDEDAPEHLRGIGIRIEDDVLVTDGEPEVLTAEVPKTVEAIEALVGR